MAKETKKSDVSQLEFFFPGSTEFHPTTVLAATQQEAHEKWLKVRQPARNPQPTKLSGEDVVQ